MKKIVGNCILAFFALLILALSIRGVPGVIDHAGMSEPYWRDEGPFELSPERGRFALTYSVIEDHTFTFALPIARFAAPDVGYFEDRYVSLFAPAISYLIIPGYLIGKSLGSAQVGSFAVISIFALFNLFLVRAISMTLGAKRVAATLAGLVFLFATPAFTYGVTIYQHHVSTFLLLSGFYLLTRFKKSLWPLLVVWFVCALSIPVDYPNAFFLAPIGVAALGRIIWSEQVRGFTKLHFKPLGVVTFLTAAIPLSLFFWYNQLAYGNAFQLAGTVQQVKIIGEDGLPVRDESASRNEVSQESTTVGFFDPRALIHGLYTLLLSADRGLIRFAPIVLLGLLALPKLYREKPSVVTLMIAIIFANIMLYGMWGDPYGGWAFGSRYLLPTYAMFSILLGLFLSEKKSAIFHGIFVLLVIYSLSVNALGAVTTSRNPPKNEAIPLGDVTGRIEKYSFDRNWDYLNNQGSKSFIFNTIGKHYATPLEYYYFVLGVLIIGFLIPYGLLLRSEFFVDMAGRSRREQSTPHRRTWKIANLPQKAIAMVKNRLRKPRS